MIRTCIYCFTPFLCRAEILESLHAAVQGCTGMSGTSGSDPVQPTFKGLAAWLGDRIVYYRLAPPYVSAIGGTLSWIQTLGMLALVRVTRSLLAILSRRARRSETVCMRCSTNSAVYGAAVAM